MADGLEQMRVAYEEMTRLRETHGEVETWLANTDVWTRKVQAQVKELSGMEPAVERIRDEVEQVKAAMSEIEARREALDDVQRRLGDLGAMSAELKERAEALRGRMESAETRFGQLAKQAEEAQLVSDTMAEVTGVGLRGREADVGGGRVGARAGEPHPAARRAGGADPPAGPGARPAAGRARQGHRAPHPRLGAAAGGGRDGAAAGGGLPHGRHDAGEGRGALRRAASRSPAELESRAAALKPIERQLSQFEELLGPWESAQAEAAKGLEQTLARQGAVEALEAEVKHVFELAERAVDNVQTIGSSRREIEETRALLEDTQSRFQVAEQALRGLRGPEAGRWSGPSSGWPGPRRWRSASAPRSSRSRRRRRWWITRWSRPARSAPDEAGGGADRVAAAGADAGRAT